MVEIRKRLARPLALHSFNIIRLFSGGVPASATAGFLDENLKFEFWDIEI